MPGFADDGATVSQTPGPEGPTSGAPLNVPLKLPQFRTGRVGLVCEFGSSTSNRASSKTLEELAVSLLVTLVLKNTVTFTDGTACPGGVDVPPKHCRM